MSPSRMKDFFKLAAEQYHALMCSVGDKVSPAVVTNILLAGLFFTVREAVSLLGGGGNTLRITGFALKADRPVRVVDRDKLGRARNVVLWVDSAVGLPDPSIRLGTASGSAVASGVRLTPGVANPFGKVPSTSELWMTSSVDITVFVVETT